jgi:hypothetical protein
MECDKGVLMNLWAVIRNPVSHKVNVEWEPDVTQLALRAQQYGQFSYNAYPSYVNYLITSSVLEYLNVNLYIIYEHIVHNIPEHGMIILV